MLLSYAFRYCLVGVSLSLLFVLNEQGNDYTILKAAYDKGWQGYGLGFQTVASLSRALSLDYYHLHLVFIFLLIPLFRSASPIQVACAMLVILALSDVCYNCFC